MNNFHLVLYRKYRPQNFHDVVGQNHITEILKKSVAGNKISHSYLFSGPKGTGKTSIARILAKSVNCENLAGEKQKETKLNEPCNECFSCKEITQGNSLDLVEIDAASNRGIDEIRSLRETVRLNPFKSKYRVYIIDEAHMLTKEAFNALLKTLEEPPRHAIFILATTEFDKIPETIASRCEHFKFKKMPEELVRLSLKIILEKEKIKIDENTLNLISILADGSLRDAHSKLEQIMDFEKKEIRYEDARIFFGAPKESLIRDFINALILKDYSAATQIARSAQKDELDLKLFIKLVLRSLRFILLLLLSKNMENEIKNETSENELNFLKSASEKTNITEIENFLKVFLGAYMSPINFHFPELPLELAIAKLAEISERKK